MGRSVFFAASASRHPLALLLLLVVVVIVIPGSVVVADEEVVVGISSAAQATASSDGSTVGSGGSGVGGILPGSCGCGRPAEDDHDHDHAAELLASVNAARSAVEAANVRARDAERRVTWLETQLAAASAACSPALHRATVEEMEARLGTVEAELVSANSRADAAEEAAAALDADLVVARRSLMVSQQSAEHRQHACQLSCPTCPRCEACPASAPANATDLTVAGTVAASSCGASFLGDVSSESPIGHAPAAASAPDPTAAFKRCDASDPDDPWFPPWVHRRCGTIARECAALHVAVKRIVRRGLASVGLLEACDAAFERFAEAASPCVARVASTARAAADEVKGWTRLARSTWNRAVENLATLMREYRAAGRARKEHEARVKGLDPEADARRERLEKLPASSAYWRRQGARAEMMGADLLAILAAAKRRTWSFLGGVKDTSVARAEAVAANVQTRIAPTLARVRLVLARHSRPLASYLIAAYPAAPPWVRRGLGPLSTVDEADMAVIVGDVAGWCLLALGAVSTLYFAVFRAHASDATPDEASFVVQHVPSNDGTFAGEAMGGGVDVKITLPGVTTAAQCEVLVKLDEVKVSALEGWHEVTVPVPKAALETAAWVAGGKRAWDKRATFDLKRELLTVRLRPPKRAASPSTSAPSSVLREAEARDAAGEHGRVHRYTTKENERDGRASPAEGEGESLSPAALKAAAAVKAATRKGGSRAGSPREGSSRSSSVSSGSSRGGSPVASSA